MKQTKEHIAKRVAKLRGQKRAERVPLDCLICNTTFIVRSSEKKKTCSTICKNKLIGIYRKNRPSDVLGKTWKVQDTSKYKGPSSETAKKISKAKTMEGHHMWKGDGVGYSALHKWVYKKLGSPDTCEYCGFISDSNKKIQWANKSQQYKRDVADWLRLCGPCHSFYDNNFKQV